MNNKKAEMGIGTLIIFIALLLVAAVAAGVLIQTAGSLQERALTTGDQAKGQIATNVKVVEVSATDGQDSTLEEFEQIIKLSPGSEDIKISQTLFTMNTYDKTATLTYKGTTGTTENNYTNGFYTINDETLATILGTTNTTLTEDYDLDGSADTAWLNAAGNIVFEFSSGVSATFTNIECTGATAVLTAANYTIAGSDEIEEIQVVSGDCGGDTTINATIIVVPKRGGEGYFTVEYLQRGTNPVDGNLQTGDVIKIYYESPREVNEDEEVRLNFIPKIGTPTLTQYITPEVVSTQRVYLYP